MRGCSGPILQNALLGYPPQLSKKSRPKNETAGKDFFPAAVDRFCEALVICQREWNKPRVLQIVADRQENLIEIGDRVIHVRVAASVLP